MKRIYREFLFEKGLLIGRENPRNPFETLFFLASSFGIEITKGQEKCDRDLVPFAAKMLGQKVPLPFYKGFPESVRELSSDALLLDQLISYYETYGLGDFSSPRHSLFEKDFRRLAFKEKVAPKPFEVIAEEEAEGLIKEIVLSSFRNTRPLPERVFDVVAAYMDDNPGFFPQTVASKDLAMRLLLRFRDYRYLKFLSVNDLLRALPLLPSCDDSEGDPKNLNLRASDRKFLSRSLDILFQEGRADVESAYEKKDLWQGFLHHIHYAPKGELAARFVKAMRGKGNRSAYHYLEKALQDGDLDAAIATLKKKKGTGALARNLAFLCSRFPSDEEVHKIVSSLGRISPTLALEILYSSIGDDDHSPRHFAFLAPDGYYKTHRENGEETRRRKSYVPPMTAKYLKKEIKNLLLAALKDKIPGKTYVDPALKKIAVPLSEGASMGGYGLLPSGSRLAIPRDKKIRAFVYWEKMNDIDLSILALTGKGPDFVEYSWRTMATLNRDYLLFSGDETSGYAGGSEYFDLDIDGYRDANPSVDYLLFSANAYTARTFKTAFVKAGFMSREKLDSGEVYEPKTVQTSFLIDANCRAARLFAVDLKNREIVWLNAAVSGGPLAAFSDPYSIRRYLKRTEIFSLYDLFVSLAAEITADPSQADLLVTDDKAVSHKPGANVVSSADFEKIAAYLR